MSRVSVNNSQSSSDKSIGLEQVVFKIKSLEVNRGPESLVSQESRYVPKKGNRASECTDAVSVIEGSQWDHYTKNILVFIGNPFKKKGGGNSCKKKRAQENLGGKKNWKKLQNIFR